MGTTNLILAAVVLLLRNVISIQNNSKKSGIHSCLLCVSTVMIATDNTGNKSRRKLDLFEFMAKLLWVSLFSGTTKDHVQVACVNIKLMNNFKIIEIETALLEHHLF